MIPSTRKKSGSDYLMLAVLTTQIQDYVNAREITDYSLQEEITKIVGKIKILRNKINEIGIKKAKSLDNMIKNIEKEIELYILSKKLNQMENKKRLLAHGEKGKRYIFEDEYPIFEVDDAVVWDKDVRKHIIDKKISSKIIGYMGSDEHVFGFKFICKYLGLDPIRLRKKIMELRKKQIKELQARIKDF